MFHNKYLKYKKKYLDLKSQIGGMPERLPDSDSDSDSEEEDTFYQINDIVLKEGIYFGIIILINEESNSYTIQKINGDVIELNINELDNGKPQWNKEVAKTPKKLKSILAAEKYLYEVTQANNSGKDEEEIKKIIKDLQEKLETSGFRVKSALKRQIKQKKENKIFLERRLEKEKMRLHEEEINKKIIPLEYKKDIEKKVTEEAKKLELGKPELKLRLDDSESNFTIFNFNRIYSPNEYNDIDFNFLDKDGNKIIEKIEFESQIKKYFPHTYYDRGDHTDPKYINDFFTSIDKNNDSHITPDEISVFSEKIRENPKIGQWSGKFAENNTNVLEELEGHNDGRVFGMGKPNFLSYEVGEIKAFTFMRYIVEIKGIRNYLILHGEREGKDEYKLEENIFKKVCKNNCGFYSIHTEDMNAPSFDKLKELINIICDVIRKKESIVIHCLAGLGRTGYLILAILLILDKRPYELKKQLVKRALDLKNLVDMRNYQLEKDNLYIYLSNHYTKQAADEVFNNVSWAEFTYKKRLQLLLDLLDSQHKGELFI